ncbi:MAG TPA: hypothetical protein VIL95_00830 [Bacillota bacterium]
MSEGALVTAMRNALAAARAECPVDPNTPRAEAFDAIARGLLILAQHLDAEGHGVEAISATAEFLPSAVGGFARMVRKYYGGRVPPQDRLWLRTFLASLARHLQSEAIPARADFARKA